VLLARQELDATVKRLPSIVGPARFSFSARSPSVFSIENKTVADPG
jgi:hypothetical protein